MLDPFSLTAAMFAAKILAGLAVLAISYVVLKYLPIEKVTEWFIARWKSYKNRDLVAVTVKQKVEAGEYAGAEEFIGLIVERGTAEVLDCLAVIAETVDPVLDEIHASEKVVVSHPGGY